MAFNPKYMITEIIKQTQERTEFNSVMLDQEVYYPCPYLWYFGKPDLKVGDIIDKDGNKIEHKNCEHAIVTGTFSKSEYNPAFQEFERVKEFTAFCAKYGDIKIKIQETNFEIPNIHTSIQRGDEILIRQTNTKPTFEIVANLTLDKLRSDFLKKQNEKQK